MTSFRRYGIAGAVVFFAALLGESAIFAVDPLDREVRHFPTGTVGECLKELSELTGAKFEVVDPSDSEIKIDDAIEGLDDRETLPTLRRSLRSYLKYVELMPKFENGVIRVYSTMAFVAHKEAAKRLAQNGAKVTLTYHLRGLGVQTNYERGWFTTLELDSKWKGNAEDLALISQLCNVQDVKIVGAKLAPGSMAALSPLKSLLCLRLDKVQLLKSDLEHVGRLTTLTQLSVAHSRVTPADLAPLQKLTNLLCLRLEGLPITDREMVYLKDLKEIQFLNLSGTRITDAGLAHLKEITILTNLMIDKTEVGDRGIARIGEQSRNLQTLRCGWTLVTDAGVAAFQAKRHVDSLSIERNYVTDKVIGDLARHAPDYNALPKPEVHAHGTFLTDEAKQKLKGWIHLYDTPLKDGFPPSHFLRHRNHYDPPWHGEHVAGPPTDLELLQGKWRLKAKVERAADGSDRQSTPGNYLSFREITGRVISTLAEPLPGQKPLNTAPVRNHLVSLESGDPKKARLMPIAGGDIQDSKGLPIAYTLEGDTLTIYFSADASSTPNPKQMKPGDRKEIFERVKVQEQPVTPPQE